MPSGLLNKHKITVKIHHHIFVLSISYLFIPFKFMTNPENLEYQRSRISFKCFTVCPKVARSFFSSSQLIFSLAEERIKSKPFFTADHRPALSKRSSIHTKLLIRHVRYVGNLIRVSFSFR